MIDYLNSDCYQGDLARKIFFRLIDGEYRYRTYLHSNKGEFGYFFEPALDAFVTFDNRMNTMLVELFDEESDAVDFLFDCDDLAA